jgi:hypothetical protein
MDVRGATEGARPRTAVVAFTRYEDARAAVDLLAERRFPVQGLAIVGEGLQYVEQVTGRRGYGVAAVQGLVNGAVTGGLVGLLLGLLTAGQPLASAGVLALWGLVVGALIGMALTLTAQAARGGRRDVDSWPALRAERYVVLADDDIAVDARRLLGDDAALMRSER